MTNPMDPSSLIELLERIQDGSLDPRRAADLLAPRVEKLAAETKRGAGSIDLGAVDRGFVDLGFAKIDTDRQARLGLPEVVFGESKSAGEIARIAAVLRDAGQNVLVTRVGHEQVELTLAEHPQARYEPRARCLAIVTRPRAARLSSPVAVVTAGTGDIPVAEEAAFTLELAGEKVRRIFDVGVAGLHRLLSSVPEIEKSAAVICVAGMEGALPSVVAGLVGIPVIAVPASIGYGVGQGGYAALLGMLSSCSAGVTVVNIDNGFGAASAVLRLARGTEARAGSTAAKPHGEGRA